SGLREAGYEAQEPETNLVLVAVDDPPEFLRALAREGVLATPGKPGYVRLCTHLDVGEREVEAAVQAAARIAPSAIER
ncbi:MAG TPA: low specificity L-threonine aldolase, partial [Rubrobacter sp.]|nr:low specificity L-threonine aldolase [Rubrobacter sp.]